MKPMTNPASSNEFIHSATIALKDIQLQTALDRSLPRSVAHRIEAWKETTDAQALRQQGRNAKLRALHDLPDMLEALEANLVAKGVHVLWAVDGDECNRYVVDIARKHDVHSIVKGKS